MKELDDKSITVATIDNIDFLQSHASVVEGKLVCDWESIENQTAIREHVGLLFRGCSCSSATAYSTCCCSCVKKGCRCGPGCRCKNCSNNAVANVPGTQQHSPVEIHVHELEQEELLHDELLRMEYGEEVVVEEETDEDNFSLEEGEGSEDQGVPEKLS